MRTGCYGPSCSVTTAKRFFVATDSLFHWSRNESWSLSPPMNVQFIRMVSEIHFGTGRISSVKCEELYSYTTVTHRLHVGRAAVRRRNRTRGWARRRRHRTHRHRPVVARRPEIYRILNFIKSVYRGTEMSNPTCNKVTAWSIGTENVMCRTNRPKRMIGPQ